MSRVDQPAELVEALCDALAEADIAYCHWKSNVAIARSASGENDLDLLVRRTQGREFNEILFGLGFRQLDAPSERRMPGVQEFIGFDLGADRFIHVQAHYQLILGHDATKNYRIPIEEPFLDSAGPSGTLRVPALEYEYVVFVMRMVLKHSPWDAILGRQGRMSASEEQELADFRRRVDAGQAEQIVQSHLPFVGIVLFRRCVMVIEGPVRFSERIRVARRLERALQGHARHSRSADLILRLWRRLAFPLRTRLRGHGPKYRPSAGGFLLAVIGGDGSGKSTAVSDLRDWLGTELDTRQIHLGKPVPSFTTRIVRALLRIARAASPGSSARTVGPIPNGPRLGLDGYTRLIWLACTARDRFRAYRKARRFVTGGGIVISDRYPHSKLRSMDVALISSIVDLSAVGALASRLSRIEKRYHDAISPAEALAVLRVEPEVAVRRKTDEPAESVRARCQEVWGIDWSSDSVHIVDANQPRERVLADLKSFLWSEIN